MERTVIPNGCHSEGLHLDVFPSPKGHVCISGTNRQHIWHCHRNMVLRMDAANEGPPVLIQPHLSITAVIIYCLHLLQCACTCTHIYGETRRDPGTFLSLSIHHSAALCFLDDKLNGADTDLYSTAQITQYDVLKFHCLSWHNDKKFLIWPKCTGEQCKILFSATVRQATLSCRRVILQTGPGLPELLHKHLCLLIIFPALDSIDLVLLSYNGE